MSNEKETPEAVEAAERFEDGMELINRARREMNATAIVSSPARGIALGMNKDSGVLAIDANATRQAWPKTESAVTRREKAIADFMASAEPENDALPPCKPKAGMVQ